MSRNIMENTGIHASRCEHASSALEKAFAEQWQVDNDKWKVLDLLLRSDGPQTRPLSGFDDRPYHFGDPPTERDATVAATVIQWLGSNVGRCFLEEAFDRAGYDVRLHALPRREHDPNCDAVLSASDIVEGIVGKPCNCRAKR
jgi:hypothetical protein